MLPDALCVLLEAGRVCAGAQQAGERAGRPLLRLQLVGPAAAVRLAAWGRRAGQQREQAVHAVGARRSWRPQGPLGAKEDYFCGGCCCSTSGTGRPLDSNSLTSCSRSTRAFSSRSVRFSSQRSASLRVTLRAGRDSDGARAAPGASGEGQGAGRGDSHVVEAGLDHE